MPGEEVLHRGCTLLRRCHWLLKPLLLPQDLCCSPGFLSKCWQEARVFGACALAGPVPVAASAASARGSLCPGLSHWEGVLRIMYPREGTVLWPLGGVSGTVQTLFQLLGREPNGAFGGAPPLEEGWCSVLSREAAAAPALTASPLLVPGARCWKPHPGWRATLCLPWELQEPMGTSVRTAGSGLPITARHRSIFFSFFLFSASLRCN